MGGEDNPADMSWYIVSHMRSNYKGAILRQMNTTIATSAPNSKQLGACLAGEIRKTNEDFILLLNGINKLVNSSMRHQQTDDKQ
jgi:hypothetical protein